jgi:F-type H+-transporting ATPase subunit b
MTLLAAGEWPWWALDLGFWSIVVFVLLVAVLGRFASKPIIRGMRERQRRMMEILARAERAREEAGRLLEKQDRERTRSRALARELVAEARRDAEATRNDVIARAREEAKLLKLRAEREIALRKQRTTHEVWTLAASLAVHVAARILETRMTPEDHRRLVHESLEEIRRAPKEVA